MNTTYEFSFSSSFPRCTSPTLSGSCKWGWVSSSIKHYHQFRNTQLLDRLFSFCIFKGQSPAHPCYWNIVELTDRFTMINKLFPGPTLRRGSLCSTHDHNCAASSIRKGEYGCLYHDYNTSANKIWAWSGITKPLLAPCMNSLCIDKKNLWSMWTFDRINHLWSRNFLQNVERVRLHQPQLRFLRMVVDNEPFLAKCWMYKVFFLHLSCVTSVLCSK